MLDFFSFSSNTYFSWQTFYVQISNGFHAIFWNRRTFFEIILGVNKEILYITNVIRLITVIYLISYNLQPSSFTNIKPVLLVLSLVSFNHSGLIGKSGNNIGGIKYLVSMTNIAVQKNMIWIRYVCYIRSLSERLVLLSANLRELRTEEIITFHIHDNQWRIRMVSVWYSGIW